MIGEEYLHLPQTNFNTTILQGWATAPPEISSGR